MNRQGGSFAAPRPGRGARGWAAEAAYSGYPQDPQLAGPALDIGAYPVDPGYRGRTSDRPRPADMPPAPPRTRPERGMPPRPGFPPRPPRQAPRNPAAANRPWPRPEEAAPQPAGGRPRPRPGRGQADGRGPATERPRPQAAGRSRPTAEETIMSNARRVPPSGSPTSPRGPRPAGFYGRGADYEQTPGGPPQAAAAGARTAGPAGSRASTTRSSTTGRGTTSTASPPRGRGQDRVTGKGPPVDGLAKATTSTAARPAPTDTIHRGPTSTDGSSPGLRRGGLGPVSPVRQTPRLASRGTGRGTKAPGRNRFGQPDTDRPGYGRADRPGTGPARAGTVPAGPAQHRILAGSGPRWP